MDRLDGDGAVLRNSNGEASSRDLVQFVPMKGMKSGASLASATLAEIPSQLMQYMKARHLQPQA